MARERLAAFNIVATYQDLEQAREAILAVQRAGINADDISVLGRQIEEARDVSERDASASETGVMADVTKAAVKGTAAGVAAGGALGFLAGALAFGIPGIGPVLGTGIWAATIGGATLGGGVGAHLGGVAALSESEEWTLTYQDELRSGHVLVAVHAEERGAHDRAVEALRKNDPVNLEEFDEQGQRLTR